MKKKSENKEAPKKAASNSVSFPVKPIIVKGKIAKPKTCVGRIIHKK